ncbi:uncharacterized protein LOC119605244 [Lucilia sericata]|uniref:uncharacterized protein LOC119605244 n=1 Tax=Lucilia sericata TaxID=13632 RepID=UPI0018A7F378|nr:uncharacterized protein LOC119605244 [Lucilia sericata]
MDLMHLIPYITLLLCLLFTLIAETSARAFTDLDTFISTPVDIDDRFNDEYFSNYQTRPVAPKDSLLNRLRRGYYYIDDGEITPVNPTDIQTGRRRQDTGDSNESDQNGVKYTPLVRYHQTHAKRKKLFVPNFFG